MKAKAHVTKRRERRVVKKQARRKTDSPVAGTVAEHVAEPPDTDSGLEEKPGEAILNTLDEDAVREDELVGVDDGRE